jgi:MoxR-like ATPase
MRSTSCAPAVEDNTGRKDFIKKWVAFGASVRAAQYLILGGKARALTSGRYHVSFEDVRALAHPVLRHRIITNFHAQSEGCTTDQIVDRCSRSCRCRDRDVIQMQHSNQE